MNTMNFGNKQLLDLLLHIEQQGITDLRLIDAMKAVPREMFLLSSFRTYAYKDVALPINCNQTISQPSVVARMTEALELTDRTKVLEIGSGSGYQTAILAYLCRRVYTIERYRPLLVETIERLKNLGINNVTTRHADGSLGWVEQAPLQRILVTAAAADIPPNLLSQLGKSGVLVAPVGHDKKDQRLTRIRRKKDSLESEDLGPVSFVPLELGVVRD